MRVARLRTSLLALALCLAGTLAIVAGPVAPAHAEDPGVYDVMTDRTIYPASGQMTVTWRAVLPNGVTPAGNTCSISFGGVEKDNENCTSGTPFSYDVGSVGHPNDATLTVRAFYTVPGDVTFIYYKEATVATDLDGVPPTTQVLYFYRQGSSGTSAPNPLRPGTVYGASIVLSDNVSVRSLACRIDRLDPDPAFVKNVTCGPPNSTLFSTPAATGSYRFTAVATDVAGNTATSTRNFVVDATPPAVTFDSGPPDGSATNAATTSWSWHADGDADATYRCALVPHGTTPTLTSCTSPYPSTALGEGAYDFLIEATDRLGNVGTTTTTVTVDRSRPSMTVVSGPADGATVTSRTVRYTFYAGSESVTYDCWFGTPTQTPVYAPCVSGAPLVLPGDGTWVLAFRARDAAGNVSDEVLRSVTVKQPVPPAPDTTAPVVHVLAKPPATVRLSRSARKVKVTVRVATSEKAVLSYKLDGGAWRRGTASYAARVAKGRHTLRIRAVDVAGNLSKVVVVGWKVVAPRRRR